jgi:hypothetical protein
MFITHKMPDGSGVVETRVGETLAGLNAFSTYEDAEAAGWSMLSDNPNADLEKTVIAGRAEREAQKPYAKYENMSCIRLAFEAIKSIRFRMP